MFSYEPMWETMKRKGITQYQLIKKHGISSGTLDALRKNQSITMHTLDSLCQMLDCEPNDIVKIVKVD